MHEELKIFLFLQSHFLLRRTRLVDLFTQDRTKEKNDHLCVLVFKIRSVPVRIWVGDMHAQRTHSLTRAIKLIYLQYALLFPI